MGKRDVEVMREYNRGCRTHIPQESQDHLIGELLADVLHSEVGGHPAFGAQAVLYETRAEDYDGLGNDRIHLGLGGKTWRWEVVETRNYSRPNPHVWIRRVRPY